MNQTELIAYCSQLLTDVPTLPLPLDESVTKPLDGFVVTKICSLGPVKPAWAGYIVPKCLVTAAREYEQAVRKQVTNGDVHLFPLPDLTELTYDPVALLENQCIGDVMKHFSSCAALCTLMSGQIEVSSALDLSQRFFGVVQIHHNNEYFKYDAATSSIRSESFMMTYPAKPWYIAKHCDSTSSSMLETYQMYEQHHLPIAVSKNQGLGWLFQILSLEKERETCLYNDTRPDIGFILSADTKWPVKARQEALQFIKEHPQTPLPHALSSPIWLLAMPHQRGILNLRHLTAEHLPLLRNIQQSVVQFMVRFFNFRPEDVLLYVHYKPTFYHLHIHVNHAQVASQTTYNGKSELLSTIIQNIQLASDYYQTVTLPMQLPQTDELYETYQALQQPSPATDLVSDFVMIDKEQPDMN